MELNGEILNRKLFGPRLGQNRLTNMFFSGFCPFSNLYVKYFFFISIPLHQKMYSCVLNFAITLFKIKLFVTYFIDPVSWKEMKQCALLGKKRFDKGGSGPG